jgi:hypothetical protein
MFHFVFKVTVFSAIATVLTCVSTLLPSARAAQSIAAVSGSIALGEVPGQSDAFVNSMGLIPPSVTVELRIRGTSRL